MQIGKFFTVNIGLVIVVSTNLGGCTQFISTYKPKPHSIVQRSVNEGGAETQVYAYAQEQDKKLIQEDRVIWIEGVDLNKSKIQRSNERKINESMDIDAKNQLIGISSYQFEFFGNELTIEGTLALGKFNAKQEDRFYVEFVNKGPMEEESVRNPMDVWRKILPALKLKGVNQSNIVMGGAKYNQNKNEILLVKIGG